MGGKPPFQPTVMGDVVRPKVALRPTLMPGQSPEWLAPEPAALQALAPEATPEVIAEAARLLALDPSRITPRLAFFWGQELQ